MSHLFLAFLATFLCLGPATAQAAPRYYAIIVANDNLPQQTIGGVTSYVVPSRQKNVAVGSSALVAYEPSKEKGLPLRFTASDALRYERFLVRHADPARVYTLLPDWESRVGQEAIGDKFTHRGPSTLAATRDAFAAIKCQVAAAKHKVVAGCDANVGGGGKTKRADATEHVVYVHFSGHGSKAGLFLRDGMLASEEFEDLVQGLGADLVVVTLDSCFGSGWDEATSTATLDRSRDVPDVVQGRPGVAVFKSANTLAEVAALESGVLTHVILSGLMGGADANGDDNISFAELSDFFYLNTSRSGQFDSQAEAPGANHQRILMDLEANGGLGETTLTLAAGLGGRVLVTDTKKRAVAEVNVQRPRLGFGRKVQLRLPADQATDKFRIYFLPIDSRGKAAPIVTVMADWEATRSESQISRIQGEPVDDTPAKYMLASQARKGLFYEHALPLNSRRLGRQISLDVNVGYHLTPMFGRVEGDAAVEGDVDDIDAARNEKIDDDLATRQQEYEFMQDADDEVWNLVHAGVSGRYHFFNPIHLEARFGAEFSPDAEFQGEPTGLLLGRSLGGLGLSGHLGSRTWIGWVSGGGGSLVVRSNPEEGDAVLVTTPWTLYAGGGLVWLNAIGGITFDAMIYQDTVPLEASLPSADGTREYLSWSITFGVEVGRWSF